MKNLTLFLAINIYLNFTYAQAPEIEWENSIGGNSSDILSSVYKTADGGYIVGGRSRSEISTDKTEDNWGNSHDYWVVKLHNDGVVQWQNTIGGTSEEEPCIVRPTSDGGYIVGGSSESPNSGDKTTNTYGGPDYWIVKLNSTGDILWQKKIGGSSGDNFTSIIQTADNGFLIGGYSFSGISGNKDEINIGGADYWVIKLNSSGFIQWQNNIGGSNDDFLYSVEQTSDGGFILGGYSLSGISGDKTEASLSTGYTDIWVVKLDNSGNIIWQNSIGGNFTDYLKAVYPTTDGGCVLGGSSNSGISGDKTESSLGAIDPWVIKLSVAGEIEWQNTIHEGGMYINTIQQTGDGGYILGGDWSWFAKLLPEGELDWIENMDAGHVLQTIEQTADEGYILGWFTSAGISLNKSEPSFGDSDYWVVKLLPDVCIPLTEVCNSIDDNCNGLIDDDVIESITITADGPTTICSGAELDINAAHSGTSIQWKKNGINIPGATSSTYSATATGTYSAQTSSDCDTELSNEIFVQVNKKPTAFIYADGPTSFCAGGSVTLIANAGGGLGYQWYKGALPIAGATNINYVATTTGNYKCLVTKIISGCNKQSNAIAVAVTCKEENELIENDAFYIFPNPSSEIIVITLSSNSLTTPHSPLTITDLSGKTIAQFEIASSSTEIDISNYASGIYFVRVIINGDQFIQKLIIE